MASFCGFLAIFVGIMLLGSLISFILSKILKVPMWLKLESLQLTGSFKIRGALFRISRLTAEERRRALGE